MEKITTPTEVFSKAALLMGFLMDMEDSLCQMEIIIKVKLNLDGQMDLGHIKLIHLFIKETLRIMWGTEKVNKKVKDITSAENTSMGRKKVAFTSIMEMFTKEISLMASLMGKVNWQQVKGNIWVILKTASNMEKANLNGQMAHLIEEIIIKVLDRVMENISIAKTQAFPKAYGKKEC